MWWSSEKNGYSMPSLRYLSPSGRIDRLSPQQNPRLNPREATGDDEQSYLPSSSYDNVTYPPSDVSRTWHALVGKSWIIILSFVVFACIGYAYIKLTPVLYSSTATIQAEQALPNILKMQLVQLQDVQDVDYLQTVAQTLSSRPLLTRVADTNKLWTDPHFIGDFRKTPTRANILFLLDRMVKVKLRRGTRLIDITVTHRVPELAATIANSIASEYIRENFEREDTAINLANVRLAKEEALLRKKLEQSENALQAYKEQSHGSSLDDRQNTVITKLQELDAKATEAKSIRIKAETEYAQIETLGTNLDALMTVPSIAQDQTVATLRMSLLKAENDFAVLIQRYKEFHPKYIEAKTHLAELKDNVSKAIINATLTVKSYLENAIAAEMALEQAMRAQETTALELSKMSIQYHVLDREVVSDRMLYDAVLKGMKEVSVAKETQQTEIIRVIQPADRPDAPIRPKKTAIMALCGIGGIFFGFLFFSGLQILDTTIRTVDEAETRLGLSVFSVVPRMRKIDKGRLPLVIVEKPKSEEAESFRTLRASLKVFGQPEERKLFLFTSAMPSEGKTFCSLNYAASLAQLGLTTLIIDADMRNPSVEINLFPKKSMEPGLTEYLSGLKSFSEIVRPTQVENLFAITGGAISSNPAELLAKEGLEGIIQEALKHYDRVILDSAPINVVSDTLLFLKSAHTVCLVVRCAWTSSRYLLRCVQHLQSCGAPFSGIVLNDMQRHRRHSASAYYDYNYHGKYAKKEVYLTPSPANLVASTIIENNLR